MENRDPVLTLAIAACGSSARLARHLGVSPQAIAQWKKVPPLRVIDVELASGIPRSELRPDLYLPSCAVAAVDRGQV